jgi:hypothetical protein
MKKRTVFSALLLVAFSVCGAAVKARPWVSDEDWGYNMRIFYKKNPDWARELCSIAREKNRLGLTTEDMAPALAQMSRQKSGSYYPSAFAQGNLLYWLTGNFCPDVR